ncbi:GYF_domain [Hexamita inflata]|uniref:GYF domain n=1 Tax=Hexamita inflata TaxID=28002 RepID=A0AA86Q7W8_9EUKA|nr:GYF domain [Hexamita inflata]
MGGLPTSKVSEKQEKERRHHTVNYVFTKKSKKNSSNNLILYHNQHHHSKTRLNTSYFHSILDKMSDESSSSSSSPILNPFKSAQSTVQLKSDQMNQQQLFEYQIKQQKRPQNLVIKREFKNAIIQTGQINVQTSASFLRDVVIPTVHKSLQTDEINQSESNEQKIQTDNYNKNNETNIKEKDSFKEQEQKMIQREQMMLKEQMNQIENKMNQNEVNSFKETDYHQQEDQMKENENVLTKNEQINEINVEQLDQMNKIDTNLKEQHNQQMKQSQNIQTDQERKKMMNQIEENAIQIKQKIQNTIKMEQIDSQKNIIQTSQNEQTKENLQENKTHESAIQDEPKMYFEKDDNSTNKQTKITYQKELVVQNNMDKHLEKETNVEESDIKISISESSDDDKVTQINKQSERQQNKEESEINISISDESKQNEQSNQIMETQKIEQESNQSQSAWFYIDSKNIRQGPYTSVQMNAWNLRQKLPLGLQIQQGLGEFRTLKQEQINLSNFFQDKEVIQDSRQYECMLAHAETQTGLNDLEISVTQTRHYFSQLVIQPSVEKCINTELSLRRGNQDELFIENTFNTFKDVQAVEVHDTPAFRKPIIQKKEQPKQGSFFENGGKSNDVQNFELNPQDEKNLTQKPELDQAGPMELPSDFEDVDFAEQELSKERFTDQENPGEQQTFSATKLLGNSTQSFGQQSVTQNLIIMKKLNLFEPILLIAINNYYKSTMINDIDEINNSKITEFKTLEDALIFYRKHIVGVDDDSEEGEDNIAPNTQQETHNIIKGSKIHLNFKQIAQECGMSEKDCRQRFQTLLANELQEWPQESVNQINQRIQQLSLQFPELDVKQKKNQIKLVLEAEFQLKQQVQYSYKEISNKINYQLTKFLGK